LFALFALWASGAARAGVVTVDVLDVGQGDAILIRGGGKTVLIDAGDRTADPVSQLKKLGVTRLDLVVATHPHADHIGRMPDVLTSFEVGLYLDNGLPHTTITYAETMAAVAQRAIPYRTAERGTEIALGDEAKFTILFPDSQGPLTNTRSDLNSNSVVMRLDHGENCFLFTGDSEEPTEQRLVADGLGQCDVLKVAHHGSNHSSTQAFLDIVQPRYALISVGVGNRYDHPGPETLARLAASGAMIYRTDLSGSLRVVSDGTRLEVLEGTLDELDGVKVVTGPPPPPIRIPASVPAPVAAPGGPALTAKEQRKADKRARKEARRAERQARPQESAGGLY
jgi:beta-lactamase superfamily II metal-dependent hydrolase